MGDSIATNMFMLGYALQKGWVPVSGAAVEKAIELNGVAVEFNLKSFVWGRRAAVDPGARAKRSPRRPRSSRSASICRAISTSWWQTASNS